MRRVKVAELQVSLRASLLFGIQRPPFPPLLEVAFELLEVFFLVRVQGVWGCPPGGLRRPLLHQIRRYYFCPDAVLPPVQQVRDSNRAGRYRLPATVGSGIVDLIRVISYLHPTF